MAVFQSQPLTRSLVEKPEIARLYLRVSRLRLDVMIYNPIEENSLITGSFALDKDSASRLKSLENTVYDNPLLLSDFQKTTILVDAPTSIVVPSQVADRDQRQMLLTAYPDLGADFDIVGDTLDGLGATILTAVDLSTLNFLRRTFANAPVTTALAPLARYFRSLLPGGNALKMLVNFRDDSLDIMATRRDRLSLLNRFDYRTVDDAVYYILACCRLLAPAPEEILLIGDRLSRDKATPILRRFHPTVMPLIFPSEMFRAGDAAMSAPFDLVVAPLSQQPTINQDVN